MEPNLNDDNSLRHELRLTERGLMDTHPDVTRADMIEYHGEPRFEDDETVVFADTRGYEYDEYLTVFGQGGCSTAKVSDRLHEIGHRYTPDDGIDHWSGSYPIPIDKRSEGFGGEQ
jgi:hypothetical protein